MAFLLLPIGMACSPSGNHTPLPDSSMIAEGGTSSDAGHHLDADGSVRNDTGAGDEPLADVSVAADADAPITDAGTDDAEDIGEDADAADGADRSTIGDADTGTPADVYDPDTDSHDVPWDGGFADCRALPSLPATSSTEARFWFSSSEIIDIRRTRFRDGIVYGAGKPPFRLDVQVPSLCFFPGPAAPEQMVEDIDAPPGSSVVVVAFGKYDSPREIRVSPDEGRTWMAAQEPGLPATGSDSVPCSFATRVGTGGAPPRMFATYGGTTVDVSDNGGLDWTRAILGSSTPAGGFVVDSAGETLWFVSEAVIDRVAAFWIPISATGPLPDTWNREVLTEWESNGVYVAEADPFDPHAIYLGGEGRLGYLTVSGTQVTVGIPWRRSPSGMDGGPYTYVTALWANPQRASHVIWGGGQQGGGPAEVLESVAGGAQPQEIPLEGKPSGVVRGIQYVPASAKLLVFLQRPDSSLAVYAVDR